MKKTKRTRDRLFLLVVIAAVLSVFGLSVPGEMLAAPAIRREDEERQSTEISDSGGVLQGLADLAVGYTVKDGTSPTRKMKSSGSGPGTGLGLCADPLAGFMTADVLMKMTDTGQSTEVKALILADQFSKEASQSIINSTLDMSGGTRPSQSALNYDALEDAYLLSGQATDRPIPTVETQSDQWQMRQ